jgi:hypothetical protein
MGYLMPLSVLKSYSVRLDDDMNWKGFGRKKS